MSVMGCGTSFVKYVLFFFNLLFALGGLAIVGIGVAVLLKVTEVTDLVHERFEVAPWLFIIVGAIVFLIAFFGCCGAIRESHCMVVTYAVFLLVIIIVQVILAVLVFVYVDDIDKTIRSGIHNAFQKARTDSVARGAYDNLEIQLECCGENGPTDYGLTNLPESCCSKGKIVGSFIGRCTLADAPNREGCASKLVGLMKTASKTIAGVAIGVACIEVVGAIFALCLANSIRNMDRRSRY